MTSPVRRSSVHVHGWRIEPLQLGFQLPLGHKFSAQPAGWATGVYICTGHPDSSNFQVINQVINNNMTVESHRNAIQPLVLLL